MAIQIKNLSYVYSPGTPFSHLALDDVSLEVPDGEFFGIIGHTGSGKSTLVQHFNALILPQKGDVMIFGQSVNNHRTNPEVRREIKEKKRSKKQLKQDKINLKALRRQVGMVFQYPEYQLFAETVFDDVAFGLKNFGEEDKSPEALEKQVREALELVGLDFDEVRNRSPFELSGGQKRRAAIAGVIVTKPKVLILDEPTAGLDPRGKKEILALIHELKRTCSPTVIMICHDMNEIAEHCTRVAVLEKSKVRFVLPPEELFLRGDLIEELGLELPAPCRIARALNKRGFDLPENLFDAASLSRALGEALRRPPC